MVTKFKRKKNKDESISLQFTGNTKGSLRTPEEACVETYHRRAVILYAEANWELLEMDCNRDRPNRDRKYNTTNFAFSKEKAVASVKF